jgi:hypothetical protein
MMNSLSDIDLLRASSSPYGIQSGMPKSCAPVCWPLKGAVKPDAIPSWGPSSNAEIGPETRERGCT